VAFDALLGVLDGTADHARFDGFAFLHAEFLHEAGDALGTEEAHEVVFKRKVEARRTGVALTA